MKSNSTVVITDDYYKHAYAQLAIRRNCFGAKQCVEYLQSKGQNVDEFSAILAIENNDERHDALVVSILKLDPGNAVRMCWEEISEVCKMLKLNKKWFGTRKLHGLMDNKAIKPSEIFTMLIVAFLYYKEDFDSTCDFDGKYVDKELSDLVEQFEYVVQTQDIFTGLPISLY